MLVGAVIALAGCGTKGDAGLNGTAGANGATGATGSVGATGATGATGTNGVNGVTGGKLTLKIESIVTAADLSKSTMTVTISPAANVCPGGTCDLLTSKVVGQKTFYAQEYNTTTGTFDSAKNIQYSIITFKGFTADGNGAQYAIDTKAAVTWAPENSTNAYAYAYVTGLAAAPAPTTGHYYLPASVASASKVFGTAPDYTSAANVGGCEKCHGKPYSKHGYRQASVAGLKDFVACKVCHTDQKKGSDADWYMKADDPANYKSSLVNGAMTQANKDKYAYTANIMNDVHNSHAFEFPYPQSMANCVTCHAGKLDKILTDANFKPTVCKSCHVVTGPVAFDAAAPTAAMLTGGVEAGRAPAMKAIWAAKGVTAFHSTIDLYTVTAATACNSCHQAGNTMSAKTFAQIHQGFNEQIYSAEGVRNADTLKVTVGATTYDPATHLLTIPFTMAGIVTGGLVKPTVVVSLYGYDSKDFVVSGHGSAADGTRLLEYTYGAMQRAPNNTLSANSARLTLTPAAPTASQASWTAVADLTTWAAQITAGSIKQVQVNVLPTLGIDQTKVVDTNEYTITGTTVAANTNYNPPVGVTGASVAIKLSTGAINAAAYGLDIVDSAKCNACHDELATTFHNPNYGSAGVFACRVCHAVVSGAGALEMQSRSIDSFVHAIHRMQQIAVSPDNFDPTKPIDLLRYADHVEANYPNFAGPLNCESCHNPGKYDVPDQTKSLPGVISASAAIPAGSRNIGTVPAQIAGPAERACGGCHRAQFINEDDAAGLGAFYAHTTVNGTSWSSTSAASLTSVTDTILSQLGVVGAVASTPAAGTGTLQVESCVICHPTSGSDHQALFNVWRNGTVQ
jgi:OmcA/MtrC family decaheme c-type cytochrome